jgi:hypothetical protein
MMFEATNNNIPITMVVICSSARMMMMMMMSRWALIIMMMRLFEFLALKQIGPPRIWGAQFAFKISKSHAVRISLELSHFATFFLV